jgi:hypothetical protein
VKIAEMAEMHTATPPFAAWCVALADGHGRQSRRAGVRP